MKKKILFAVAFLLSGLLSTGFAQIDLPYPSPKATVGQMVGLTNIKIEYSSPGVKGRKIWDDLVPYNEMWRTGANKATLIEFTQDVKVEGQELAAGKYSLFTIPAADEWTIVFNKETELWGTGGYSEEEDALRVKVHPVASGFRERMAFIISDFDYEKATINLEWDKIRVPVNIEVSTDEQALNNIEQALSSVPGQYANAARYTLRAEDHYDKGLEWINKSIELEEGWYNNWIKAQILAKQGNYKEGYAFLKKAKELGDQSERFFYKDKVEKELEEWKKKL